MPERIKYAAVVSQQAVVAEMRALRDALPDADLMVDLHWRYGVDEALDLARELATSRPYFVEAPVAPEDVDGLAEVCRRSGVPVAAGEEWRNAHEARLRLAHAPLAFVQPEIAHTGVSQFLAIAKLVALATLMPIVASVGGNTGNQTVALMIRRLALGQIAPGSLPHLFGKELSVSLLNGAVWGGAMGLVALALYGSPALGLVGKVDCLRRRDGSYLPYEHKRGKPCQPPGQPPSAWPSDRLQVIAYAALLEDAFGQPVPEGRVRYHAANVTILVPVDDVAREDLRRAINQARRLRASVERPPIADNERLCARCSLAPVCLPEEVRHDLAALEHVRDRIARHRARRIEHEDHRERGPLGLEPLALRIDPDRRPQRRRAGLDILVLRARD